MSWSCSMVGTRSECCEALTAWEANCLATDQSYGPSRANFAAMAAQLGQMPEDKLLLFESNGHVDKNGGNAVSTVKSLTLASEFKALYAKKG